MAVPKKKTSKAVGIPAGPPRQGALKSLVSCSRCGEPRLPHRACPKCGFYKDRIVPGAAEG
jgi:large subunit ribosomal protein L32